jgi:hypothetical protein
MTNGTTSGNGDGIIVELKRWQKWLLALIPTVTALVSTVIAFIQAIDAIFK